MLWCVVTGKPAWNSSNPHSVALTTAIRCEETVIHTLLSEAVRGTLALRPRKQREVAPSLTHAAAVVQPRQAEQSPSNAHAFCPFSLSAHPVGGLGFRREGPDRPALHQQVLSSNRCPYRPARSHCVQTRLRSLPNLLLLPNLLSLGL